MLVLLITYVLSGAVMVALAVPLIQRRIKPNGWYGFRTRKTLQHEDLWYDVNAISGRYLSGTGLATILASLVLYPLNISDDAYSLMVLFVMLTGIFYTLWQGLSLIRRYEAE